MWWRCGLRGYRFVVIVVAYGSLYVAWSAGRCVRGGDWVRLGKIGVVGR